MVCPDCHTKVMSFTEYCRKCGADLQQTKIKEQKRQHHIFFQTF